MSDLTIQWPDAQSERVEAAKGRLDVAGARLRSRSQEGVLSVLASVFELWRDPTSRWRRKLLTEYPGVAGFLPETARVGLDLALADWTGEALCKAFETELPGLEQASSPRISPFSMTSVLLAGAIPMPSLLACVLPLGVRSPVLVKSASRDPFTPRLLAESIAEVDPELGRCIEVVSFPSDDAECLGRFMAAECVVANGSDSTIREIARQIRPSQRFVAYGHKLSLAIVAADSCRDESSLEAMAHAISLDVALWDQLGCLSPVALYVLGKDAATHVAAVTDGLANALARREAELPRGPIDLEAAAMIRTERDGARMRAAAGASVELRESAGTQWTVIGEAESDWRPAPLHRFLRVHAVPNLDALANAIRPIARNLSSVAISGFEKAGRETRELGHRLSLLGASRICPAGRLQAPPLDWPRDGRPIVLPLCRFTQLESAPSQPR